MRQILMNSATKQFAETTLAKTLAPEDVCPGDYVAVLDVEYEYPMIVWSCDTPISGADEVVRVRMRAPGSPSPLKVREVCIPFVYADAYTGRSVSIDLRSVRLARLDPSAARRMWKRLKGSLSKRKSKKRKRRKRD